MRHKNKAAMKAYSEFIVAAMAKEAVLLALNSLPYDDPFYSYGQKHRIYPRCLTKEDTSGAIANGDNRASNLVFMTFADHLQAHVLLAAVYCEHAELLSTPAFMLSCAGDFGSSNPEVVRAAAKLASEASTLNANQMAADGRLWLQTDACKAQHGLNMKAVNKKHAGPRNSRLKQEGRHPSQKAENKAATGARATEQWGKKVADGTHPAFKQEYKDWLSARQKAVVVCPHCGKSGKYGGMAASHFSNCLEHPDNLGLTRKQIRQRLGRVSNAKPLVACEHCLQEVTANQYATRHGNKCRAKISYVLATSLATGEAATFATNALARDATGVPCSKIRDVSLGIRKHSYGWHFELVLK